MPPLRDPLNSGPSNPPQGGGNYYLMADVDLSRTYVWTSVAGCPPGADPMQGSCKLTQIPRPTPPQGQPVIPGDWCMLRGLTPGWVKIECRDAATNTLACSAYYRLYQIVILEDEVGGKLGFDPRFGGAEPQLFDEEGGFHFKHSAVEPAAESLMVWDDTRPPAGLSPEDLAAWIADDTLVPWTGLQVPGGRTAHWVPESQLKPTLQQHQGQWVESINSLVATTRDEQYVRVWLHGPVHDDPPIPIHVVCTSQGTMAGQVKPGEQPPAPSYEITGHYFKPPANGVHPGNGDWVESAECPVVTQPKIHVKDHRIDDLPASDVTRRRKWILRIPWQGYKDSAGDRKTSGGYADIEVEARIPIWDAQSDSYAGMAYTYGHDPFKLLEGVMQLRWGTVIELDDTGVRAGEPTDLTRLKHNWFRLNQYTLHNDNAVATPDMVTLGLGMKAVFGADGVRVSDNSKMEATANPEANDYTSQHSDRYIDETMLSGVNSKIVTTPPPPWANSFWIAGRIVDCNHFAKVPSAPDDRHRAPPPPHRGHAGAPPDRFGGALRTGNHSSAGAGTQRPPQRVIARLGPTVP